MKLRISAGDVAIEREIPNPPTHAVFARAPFAVRRKRMLDAVARKRRSRFRLVAGGATAKATTS